MRILYRDNIFNGELIGGAPNKLPAHSMIPFLEPLLFYILGRQSICLLIDPIWWPTPGPLMSVPRNYELCRGIYYKCPPNQGCFPAAQAATPASVDLFTVKKVGVYPGLWSDFIILPALGLSSPLTTKAFKKAWPYA